MASKFLPLLFGIGLTFGVAQVQPQLLTGTPTESPSPSKHRTSKETGATASPAGSATSPSAAESPAASPKPKRIPRKATAEMPASPTPTPVASPTPANQNQVPTFVQTEEVAVRQSSRRELSAYKLKWRCDRANATPAPTLSVRWAVGRRLATKALQERRQQSRQSLLMVRSGIDFSRGR